MYRKFYETEMSKGEFINEEYLKRLEKMRSTDDGQLVEYFCTKMMRGEIYRLIDKVIEMPEIKSEPGLRRKFEAVREDFSLYYQEFVNVGREKISTVATRLLSSNMKGGKAINKAVENFKSLYYQMENYPDLNGRALLSIHYPKIQNEIFVGRPMNKLTKPVLSTLGVYKAETRRCTSNARVQPH